MLIDLEVERVRAAFDTPEQYPGEALEGVIYGLMGDVADANHMTVEGRRELRALCERIITRVEQRERIGPRLLIAEGLNTCTDSD